LTSIKVLCAKKRVSKKGLHFDAQRIRDFPKFSYGVGLLVITLIRQNVKSAKRFLS